jgi:hypothetical protein
MKIYTAKRLFARLCRLNDSDLFNKLTSPEKHHTSAPTRHDYIKLITAISIFVFVIFPSLVSRLNNDLEFCAALTLGKC